jgi:hypothetical protein
MSTREQALATLASLSPAPVFLDSYRTKQLPESLHAFFGPPEEFFLAPDTIEPYAEGRLVPLLDDGNFGIVTFYDPSTGGFVQKDVEEPEKTRATFANWQQYLADLMFGVADSGADDAQMRRVSELIKFPRLREFTAFLDLHANDAYDDFERSKAEFIAGIQA